MTNDEIIDAIELTAKLLELHGENPFKVKALTNAAFKLSKLRFDFSGKSQTEVEAMEGVGKGISAKIIELMQTGTTGELQSLLSKTPPGVIEMLAIKGLGPKKVRQLWQELEIESIGELLYACNENRLVSLKGFGEKTQNLIQQNIAFLFANRNKFHYASVEEPLLKLVSAIQKLNPTVQVAIVGQMARKYEVIDKVEILTDQKINVDLSAIEQLIPLQVIYHHCTEEMFFYKKLELSSSVEHLTKLQFSKLSTHHFNSEEEIYQNLDCQFIEPELREGLNEFELAKQHKLPQLIQLNDLKGILHNHTTYSDGVDTLSEMANYCKELGYSYLGICDHSKSAFYANGLSEERVFAQQMEIDQLNEKFSDFKILKGIESDILNDGSLDYSDSVLKTFDFVVASVHSNLKMSEQKATERLIKAIENPYTSILGHPTGRLLLSRSGYPIDHKKVIDACAANKVSVELNAHPYRLDIDWRWIPYCLEKGVRIAINPDAHHKEGYHDMYYGVCVARKGMLDKTNCLNALDLNELIKCFKK